MAEIHGLVYLIGGIVLAIVSFILNGNSWEGNFILFFFLGIVGVIIGLFKLISKKKEEHHKRPQHNVQQGIVGYCHSCGSALGHLQQFCHRCGARIFHR